MYLGRGSQTYSNIPHACLWVFQVWLLSKEEPSNRYPGLAVTLGDCDWLLFLLLWGGASEPHWRPPAVASHCSGWHHPFPTGQCWKDLCFPHSPVFSYNQASPKLHKTTLFFGLEWVFSASSPALCHCCVFSSIHF